MSRNTQNTPDAPEALTGRYASSIGWDPNRSKPDERDLARKAKLAREEYHTREALARAIDLRPARALMRRDLDEDPQPANAPTTLFPPFWYPGQLAVLTGPSDGTLSLFAVQLAEQIAGTRTLLSALPPGSPPYRGFGPTQTLDRSVGPERGVDAGFDADGVVLPSAYTQVNYLDLAKTRRQYRELYSHNGRRYRFSASLNLGLLADEPLPERYKGRREQFYHDAIATKLGEIDEPTVVIIDNLSWLSRSGSPTELRQLLRSFRSHVNHTGNSILLLAPDDTQWTMHNGQRTVRSTSKLSTVNRQLSTFADTVFSLNPSTFAPDHFYLKLLKSGSPPYEGGVASPAIAGDDGVVLSPTIYGSPTQNKNSPPDLGGVDAASADGVVVPENSQLSVLTSQLASPVHVYRLTRFNSPPSLFTAGVPAGASPRGVDVHSSPFTERGAFPGFEFLAIAPEEQHTKDYAAEIAKFEAALLRAVEKEERRRKLSAKESLAQGVIDGSYARYLLDE